jgi:hypothetical protein
LLGSAGRWVAIARSGASWRGKRRGMRT